MSAAARARMGAAGAAWALAGAAWAAWWARLGPGMTADTIDYLGIGRAPFALVPDVFQWPPAFWFLLQCARAVGLPAWGAAALVMAGARALLAAGAYRLGAVRAGPWGGHLFALATFLWVPLTYASLYCLSETLFLGALVWWLAAAHAQRTDADAAHAFRRTTAWAMLMVSTRFLGAPLAFVEWGVGAVALRRTGVRRWWVSVLLAGACIVGPAVLWAGLGRVVSGQAFGRREPTLNPLPVHLQRVGTAWWDPLTRGRYGDVFWGDQAGLDAPPLAGQALLYACAAIVIVWSLLPRRGATPWWRTRLAGGAILYLATLVAVSARVWIDPIGPRFLLPVMLLAFAGAWHRPSRVRLSGAAYVGVAVWLGLWLADGLLVGRLTPRLGTVFGAFAFIGTAASLGAAWLDPNPSRARAPFLAIGVACALVLAGAQARWSAAVLARTARAAMPSVQHPGWRLQPGVRALRDAVRPGDTIVTHTPDTVRALLGDRRDVTVEPWCFVLLNRDCARTLEQYLADLDAGARAHQEWIVLLDRVALPYLFLDDLRAAVRTRPHVRIIERGTVYAYAWPPTSGGRTP